MIKSCENDNEDDEELKKLEVVLKTLYSMPDIRIGIKQIQGEIPYWIKGFE